MPLFFSAGWNDNKDLQRTGVHLMHINSVV